MYGFDRKEKRDSHFNYCIGNGDTRKAILPKKGKNDTIKFLNGFKQLKVPFTMFADFESLLVPAKNANNKKKTTKINDHLPSGFCVYSKYAHGNVENPLKLYRGPDCAEKFCKYVVKEAKRLYNMFPKKEMSPLTGEEKKDFINAKSCHICEGKIDDDDKVRDHCHYTGKFRGAAHKKCNLNYKTPKHIPIILHNLSGYDSHLFICELAKLFDKKNISVIADNYEKYISFSVKVLVDEKKILN